MSQLKVTIAGAGIFGLWQALLLSRAGHAVHVLEKVPVPFAETASQYAGAMIAPYCEAESAEPIVRDLGLHAARLWRNIYPELIQNVPAAAFQGVDRIEPGMAFEAKGPSGEVEQVLVEAVEGDQVRINANHPLAGVTLNFDVTVVAIREADQSEIEHGHVH